MGTVATGCQTMVLYRCGNAASRTDFQWPAPRSCAFKACAGGARRPCQDSVRIPQRL